MSALIKSVVVLIVALSTINFANAGIIGVLTESSATATVFRPDADGNPRVVNFSGAQISESYGGVGLGSAASFDTTSRVGVGVVEFQNGNASYGEGVVSTSRTVVDVEFENTGTEAVRPTLNSQITPAGLGLFVSGCQAADLRTCELRDDGDYDWQDVGNSVAPGEAAVGSRFDFKVMSGSEVLFSLTGGVSLVLGENGNPNRIVRDFGEVENFLNDFRQTSPDGTEQQITFDWGATDFLVEFPEHLLLAPGESGAVTYITEVTTFSNAFCYDTGRQACPIAYGSFGDPIGRGGAAGPIKPSVLSQLLAQPLSDSSISGLDFGLYEFGLPTFENGQIGFTAISGPGIGARAVAEPKLMVWMLVAVAGLLVRRRRMHA